jgi:N6-adenosine-specific RNA methylase IME4
LADPPWHYRNFTDAVHGAASSAYATMDTRSIAEIPAAMWAEDDAVLALWGTWPLLPDALAVMAAWGFAFVTGCPWVKTSPSSGEIRTGIGFWWQSASELLLIGRRGRPTISRFPILAYLEGEPRAFYAPRGREHSRKPPGVHEWLERKAPGPRLELFATQAREGWTCWGDSLGQTLSPHGCHERENREEP